MSRATTRLSSDVGAAQELAADGHVATDRFGHSLFVDDPVMAAKVRRKLDLRLIGAILPCYMFCFIDVSSSCQDVAHSDVILFAEKQHWKVCHQAEL